MATPLVLTSQNCKQLLAAEVAKKILDLVQFIVQSIDQSSPESSFYREGEDVSLLSQHQLQGQQIIRAVVFSCGSRGSHPHHYSVNPITKPCPSLDLESACLNGIIIYL